ncbi:MAG TPA: TetR/AcrR family transcriptional regulator [Candidatus Acidoferrum sp.]|jgi:AcrR family transcriptional regulator
MPPHADQLLEERILKAAQRLWRTRGEEGLTLRAVAKEAATTTPTVYKRFRNKEALMIGVAMRIRSQLNEALFAAKSVQQVYRVYLRFAEEHPHEYQLLFRSWTDIFHPDQPRPGRVWFMTQLANRFGGAPEDYDRAFYAFFLLAHGAASLLSVPSDEVASNEVRNNFLAISDTLLKNIKILRT